MRFRFGFGSSSNARPSNAHQSNARPSIGLAEGPAAQGGFETEVTPGHATLAAKTSVPQSLEGIALASGVPTTTFLRGVDRTLDYSEPAAGQRQTRPAITAVDPRLEHFWKRLEQLELPEAITRRIEAAAENRPEDVQRAAEILDSATQALLDITTDSTEATGPKQEARRVVQERLLDCLIGLNQEDAHDRWLIGLGLSRLYATADYEKTGPDDPEHAFLDPEYIYALIASPDFAEAFQEIGRCFGQVDEPESRRVLQRLVERLGNLARALPLERGRSVLASAFKTVHEGLQADACGKDDREAWADLGIELIRQHLDVAYAFIDAEWMSELGDLSNLPPAVRAAIRNTLAECPQPAVRERLRELIHQAWFVELAEGGRDDTGARTAGALVFCIGVMEQKRNASNSTEKQRALLNATTRAIMDESIPIRLHYFSSNSPVVVSAFDGKLEINPYYYADTGLLGLSETLELLALDGLPHDVNHIRTNVKVGPTVEHFLSEYRAHLVGHLARYGRLPRPSYAAALVAELLTSRDYPNIYSGLRRDPKSFHACLGQIFQCDDPTELERLDRDALRARAQAVCDDRPLYESGWLNYEINAPKPDGWTIHQPQKSAVRRWLEGLRAG